MAFTQKDLQYDQVLDYIGTLLQPNRPTPRYIKPKTSYTGDISDKQIDILLLETLASYLEQLS